jgi:hypothetical protein
MKANDFVKVVKELTDSKKLGWSSFEEKRIWDIGKRFENKEIDKDQAIVDIAGELKNYNVGRDETKFLKDKMK